MKSFHRRSRLDDEQASINLRVVFCAAGLQRAAENLLPSHRSQEGPHATKKAPGVPGLPRDDPKGVSCHFTLSRLSDFIPKRRSRKARIATALPVASRETLQRCDNRHSASSAKNSDENQVAAIQRKAKTKTREQGKSDRLP